MVAKRSSGLRRGRRRDVRSSQQAQDRPEVKRNERENPWQFRGSQERQGQQTASGGLEGRRECYQTLGKRPESGQRPTPAPGRPAGTTVQEELQVGPLVYIRKPSDKRKFRKSTYYLWAFEACLQCTLIFDLR